jgi:hypothetical protein
MTDDQLREALLGPLAWIDSPAAFKPLLDNSIQNATAPELALIKPFLLLAAHNKRLYDRLIELLPDPEVVDSALNALEDDRKTALAFLKIAEKHDRFLDCILCSDLFGCSAHYLASCALSCDIEEIKAIKAADPA